jgi:hypothetical protein
VYESPFERNKILCRRCSRLVAVFSLYANKQTQVSITKNLTLEEYKNSKFEAVSKCSTDSRLLTKLSDLAESQELIKSTSLWRQLDKIKSINDGEIYLFAVSPTLNLTQLLLPSKLIAKVYVNETNYFHLIYQYQFQNIMIVVGFAFLGLFFCLFFITYHSKFN